MGPSHNPRRFAIYSLLVWLLVGLWTAVSWADEDTPRFAGRSLEEALDVLRQDGLRLFYTNKVVRSDLLVEDEPRAREPKAILTELLTPHGLMTRPGPGGRLMIVKAGPDGIARRGARPSQRQTLGGGPSRRVGRRWGADADPVRGGWFFPPGGPRCRDLRPGGPRSRLPRAAHRGRPGDAAPAH